MLFEFDYEINEKVKINTSKLDKFYSECKLIKGFENVKLVLDDNDCLDSIVVEKYDDYYAEDFAIELSKIIDNDEMVTLYFKETKNCEYGERYDVSRLYVVPATLDWVENEPIEVEEEA